MKALHTTALFLTTAYAAFAQNFNKDYSALIQQQSPDFCLAFSTGLDNYSGLIGIGALIPISEKLQIRAGAGIGSWGAKLSAGLKFQELTESGFGFGIGYSHCTGLEDVELTLSDSNGNNEVINMTLNKAGSVNLTVNKNWVFKRGNIFYIESGYAIGTGGNPDFIVNDGTVLSDEAELVMD
ncbi:MAG: hypothetical protein AAF616_13380, partial [Bacteroidota bacterium]